MGMSTVQICNMALSRLGVKRISALTDNNKIANECNTIFNDTRDSVLADYDWGFARMRQDLALLSDTYSGWTYAYAYPANCLGFRKIYDGTGALTGTSYDIDKGVNVVTGTVEFEVFSNSNGDAKVIGSEMAEAEGIFTIRVTNTSMFSLPFVDALADRLASHLAIPLKGKRSLLEAYAQSYFLRISSAGASNANEGYAAPSDSSSFSSIR